MGFKLLFHVAALVLLQSTANILVASENGAFLALRGSQMDRHLEDATLNPSLSVSSVTTIPDNEEEEVVVEEEEEEEDEEIVTEEDDPIDLDEELTGNITGNNTGADDDIVFDDDLFNGNNTDRDNNSTDTDDDEIAPLGDPNPLNNGGNVTVQIEYLIKYLQRPNSINRDEEASLQTTGQPGSETKSIFLARQESIERTVPSNLFVRG